MISTKILIFSNSSFRRLFWIFLFSWNRWRDGRAHDDTCWCLKRQTSARETQVVYVFVRGGRGEHGRCVNGWGTSLRPVAILTSTTTATAPPSCSQGKSAAAADADADATVAVALCNMCAAHRDETRADTTVVVTVWRFMY